MNVVSGKKVAFIIASQGYQAIEYLVPKKALEAQGIKVITVSDKPGGAVAHDNSTTAVDLTLDQLNVEKVDGIFLIGGPGALDCLDNAKSYHLINEAKKRDLPYGAICISPRILAKAGGLTGLKATGWNNDNALNTIFTLHGAFYQEGKDIVTDGLVVTATGPQSAQEFAQGIIRVLSKKALGA